MAEDFTYQTTVYHERGGGAQVARSDGIIRGHSGGIMSAESGYNLTLASQTILAKDMVRIVHSWNEPVVIIPAAASVTLQESNLPYNVRFVTIVGSVTMSKASFWLTSCSAGAEVYLRLVGDVSGGLTNANTSVFVSLSGCTLMGSNGNPLSGFDMHTSAASDCGVHLVSPTDNTWAIVTGFGDIDERVV